MQLFQSVFLRDDLGCLLESLTKLELIGGEILVGFKVAHCCLLVLDELSGDPSLLAVAGNELFFGFLVSKDRGLDR